ncbi:PREDICTED: defensin-like protein 90 [Camelina sativa]|uniref:Defensin-like protein 90 n=1 Tax=Camelina sativa TaxID=90675 RepID=A0ABM1RPF2_CAMSA|nr:PREDICTED: defensin-like protein 90 [Camelina sativa]
MATNKFTSVLLLSLVMFALILLPMISGQYYKCKFDGCKITPVCDRKCMSMGYPRRGVCRIYSFGGVCCCELSVKPPYYFILYMYL